MDWQEIKVKVNSLGVEAVSDIFVELGSGGVVIEEQSLRDEYIAKGCWDYYDLPDLHLKEDQSLITGYLPIDDRLIGKLEDLQYKITNLNNIFNIDLKATIEKNIVKEVNWANAWKAYYKPEKIGKRIVIKPTWEEYKKAPDELIVELDPGMAFGTGSHPTTSMCIEFLDSYINSEMVVLDVGTGSGILAIAAAKLGAKKVLAVDLDPIAVNVARENVIQNNVGHMVDVLEGNLLDKVTSKADLVVANIIADIIILGADDMVQALAEGGYLIASGIIKDRRQDVENKLLSIGLNFIEIKEKGEWVAVLAQKGV